MRLPLSHYLQKLAEIGGGDGENDSFEQAFSNLAHAYIQSEAPDLENYELGFQLLERSDDGKRGVGIIGFQINKDSLLYSPVFWLRGRIKGHELLYLKNQNMFVPMKENWLNYILQRKPPKIGEGVSRNPKALGIRQPDILRMTRSPYKYASDAGAQDSVISLPEFIEAAGQAGVREFAKFADAAPELAALAYDIHGQTLISSLESAAAIPEIHISKSAKQIKLDVDPIPTTPLVRITSYSMIYTDDVPKDLTDDEQKELLSRGVTIRDSRPNSMVSQAYYEQPSCQIFNPTTNGLYDVITPMNGIQRCLILINPWAPSGRCRFATAIFVDLDNNPYQQTSLKNISCTKQYSNEEAAKYGDKLASAKSLNSEDTWFSDRAIVLTPDLKQSSVPLRMGDRRDNTTFEIDDYDIDHESNSYDTTLDSRPYTLREPVRYLSSCKLSLDSSDTTNFRAMDGILFVPGNTKTIQVSKTYDRMFGKALDLQQQMYRSMCKLAIYRSGEEVSVKGDRGILNNTTPIGALDHLINRYGLGVQAAQEILKTAAVQRNMKVLVKLSSAYLSDDGPFGPSSPPFQDNPGTWQMAGGDTAIMREPTDQQVPMQIPRTPYPPKQWVNYVEPEQAMTIAQQAARTGQKDVFDVGIMTSMLRNMRDDQLIDRYIPALARAMDAMGRLLFQFYWHQEDFAERYGDKDMPDMEDSFRNLFESLGDIVLKLKQKTVDPYPEDQQYGVSLSDLAGAS